MRKSSLIFLGFGIGYLAISISISLFGMPISLSSTFAIVVSALLFAIAEFFNSSFRYIVLCIRQSIFSFCANIAFTYFEKTKNIVIKKSKKSIRYNIFLYTYWYNKLIANHFSKMIRKQYFKLQKTGRIAILFYILAPSILVFLLIVHIENFVLVSDKLNLALSLFPLGILFINIFFESELSDLNENFYQKVDLETKRLQESIKDFRGKVLSKGEKLQKIINKDNNPNVYIERRD